MPNTDFLLLHPSFSSFLEAGRQYLINENKTIQFAGHELKIDKTCEQCDFFS